MPVYEAIPSLYSMYTRLALVYLDEKHAGVHAAVKVESIIIVSYLKLRRYTKVEDNCVFMYKIFIQKHTVWSHQCDNVAKKGAKRHIETQ